MFLEAIFIIATFTEPEKFGANPQSMLWLLPLVAAIAIIYKATKLPVIKAGKFIKETAIVVFIVIAALTLHALAWLISG